MKTFLVVSLYTVMVAALDLGGAVWTSLHTAHPAKAVGAAAVSSAVPVKIERATRSVGTNLSRT